MKKITFIIAVLLLISFVGKAQNLIQTWNGYKASTSTYATGAGSEAKYWGWSTNPATAETNWGQANGGGIRFMDNVSGYAAGRIFYTRWDGALNTAGLYVLELDTISVEQLTAGHSYTLSWSYAWNSNASAPTLTTRICTSRDGVTGAIAPVSVTGTSVAISGTTETFPCSGTSKSMRTGTITFIPPTTTDYYFSIGSSTGSLCAIRDLSLIDNGVVSYISTTPATLSFTPNSRTKSLNIVAGGISSNLSLSTATANYTLSRTSITPAEATATGGVNIDITSTGVNNGIDTILISSGTTVKKVPISLTSSLNIGTRAFFIDQSTQDSLNLTISGDLYDDISLTSPTGVSLQNVNNTPINTITKADALLGKVIKAKWDKTTRIINQKITFMSGALKDSLVVIAIPNNKISTWDADTITTANSSLQAAGWTENDATGTDLGALSNLYNTTGIRIVSVLSAAHTYLGKLQAFGRTAYFRTWGAAAPFNSFNLSMTLDASTTYAFRGIAGWHNNGSAPNVTISVNTSKSGLGTSLGSQTVICPTKQAGTDFGFEFTTDVTGGQYYLVVTCDQSGDAMISPDYLAIYPKMVVTSTDRTSESKMILTVSNGYISVKNVSNYSIYTIQGVKVADVKNNTANTSIHLNQGIYLVKSSDSICKVFVR
jgi:hypothetical protein